MISRIVSCLSRLLAIVGEFSTRRRGARAGRADH
jgi:hypothetical protein